jgi:uncharacterized membrane protein YfcA
MEMGAGNCDFGVFERLLVGGVGGAALGGFLSSRIPSRPMKWALSVYLGVLGVQLFLHGIWV